MKNMLLGLVILGAATMVALAPQLAAAAPPSCGKDGSGNPIYTSIDFGSTSKLCTGQGASPVTAILLWVINFLAVGVGVAVVIGIIFGGITYAMSDGDSGKAKQGMEIIANAIIGLFLFLFMYAAANFMVPGGLFT